ncbi:MAG: Flp pilus assembly protein CpaB [Proteobacteria bacterium]|nr:Flp pilus assembly protein CpaB [Pseudomonadota bacterium]
METSNGTNKSDPGGQRRAFVVAVLAALLGIALMTVYMRKFERETSGGPRVDVLSALRNIAPGTPVDHSVLGVRQIPQAYLEARHIPAADVDAIVGVRVVTALSSGDSLLWTDIAKGQSGTRTLAALVQPGMRAVTIRVANGSALGNMLRPGDRVDVLYSSTKPAANATHTILQSMLLLSVGGRIEGDTGCKSGWGLGSEVTLSASPQHAQLLTHAQQHGVLTLVLRNHDDVVHLKQLPASGVKQLQRVHAPPSLYRQLQRALARPLDGAQTPNREIEHVQ